MTTDPARSTRIDSRTQLVGLMGWPVKHSVSPPMQNAAFDALGLNWRYVPLPVRPGQVGAAIDGLHALGFRGANVTVPHKQDALRALDAPSPAPSARGRKAGVTQVSRDAQAVGAVNTIVVAPPRDDEEGERSLRGYNTDVSGFLGALRAGAFRPPGASAVVVGAGGGARAVVFGLLQERAKRVIVLNRTPERAEQLISDLASTQPALQSPTVLQAVALSRETLIDTARRADLLVNASPVGMWPRVDRSIWPDGVPLPAHLTVFDLVYNPLRTRLLEQARAEGANAVDGLEMLVQQGALALELWTGESAPLQVMREAGERSLKAHSSP